MKNSSDIIENRTRDLPACSEVPEPTEPSRAQLNCPKAQLHSDVTMSETSRGLKWLLAALKRVQEMNSARFIGIFTPTWRFEVLTQQFYTENGGRFRRNVGIYHVFVIERIDVCRGADKSLA